MNKRVSIKLTRTLLYLIAAPLVWMSSLGGWFGLASGHSGLGTIFVTLAVVVVVILLEGHLVSYLVGREMPVGSLILLSSIIALVALDELANLVTSSPPLFTTLGFPIVLSTVVSIGFVLLTGLLIWRLFSLVRQRRQT
jgi:hypothetical protein